MNNGNDNMDTDPTQPQNKSNDFIPKIWLWVVIYLLRPSVLGVIALSLLLLMVLFFNPVIGMGDDGSTAGVIAGSNLYNTGELTPKESLSYFQKNWGIMQYYNDSDNVLMTTQTPFINAAKRLDIATTWDGTFDLRFYAGVIAIFYLFSMYFLFETVTYGKRSKWTYVVVTIGVFIFGDTAYTAWMNSFYPQCLSFFSVVLIGTALILMGQKHFNDYALLAVYFFSATLLSLLNHEYALLGVCLGGLGILLKYVDPKKSYKRICIVGGSLLMVISLAAFILMPSSLTNLNKYHSMTRGILLTATNPETALDYFGINPQYSILTGTVYYQAISPATMNSSEMQAAFFNKINPVEIAVYYIGNPDQLYAMMNLAVESSFNIRPSWLGNYQISQGYPPGAQTDFFTGWSYFKANIIPGNFGFVIIWMGIIIAVYVRNFRKGFIEKNERNTLRFLGLMTWLFIGIWELYFAVISTGDTDSLGRLFAFSLTFDLISFVILGKLVHWLEKKMRKTDMINQIKKFFKKKGTPDDEQRGYD